MAASLRASEPFLKAERVALDLGWPIVFGTIRVDDARIVNPHIRLATDAQGMNLPPALQQRMPWDRGPTWMSAGSRSAGLPLPLQRRRTRSA